MTAKDCGISRETLRNGLVHAGDCVFLTRRYTRAPQEPQRVLAKMKLSRFSLTLLLSLSASFGQSIAAPPPANNQQTFDAAYWASQPTAVQSAHSAGTLGSQCLALANQGYVIDEWIMCWGNDAYWAMVIRAENGYTWVPSLLQTPIGANPGYAEPGLPPLPGQTAYPIIPPPGSVIVSTSVLSYPAYSAPVSISSITSPQKFSLGPQIGTGEYLLISNTGVTPALGSTLTVGSTTGSVVKVGPFAYGLQVNQ